MNYFKKVLLGLDQFGNTVLGGAPDETISARSGRLRGGKRAVDRLWWKPLAWTLNCIDKGHTDGAECSELEGKQQDPAYAEVFDPDDAPNCETGDGR